MLWRYLFKMTAVYKRFSAFGSRGSDHGRDGRTFGAITIDNENRGQYTEIIKIIRLVSDTEKMDTVPKGIGR